MAQRNQVGLVVRAERDGDVFGGFEDGFHFGGVDYFAVFAADVK
jgi:hypothetical protein